MTEDPNQVPIVTGGNRWQQEATGLFLINKHLANLDVDGSKEVCPLKQTCTPTLAGSARTYITTITDVFLRLVQ